MAVEIVSKDRSRHQVEAKLRDCRRAGGGEVVRFDPAGELRLFDFIEGEGARARSRP